MDRFLVGVSFDSNICRFVRQLSLAVESVSETDIVNVSLECETINVCVLKISNDFNVSVTTNEIQWKRDFHLFFDGHRRDCMLIPSGNVSKREVMIHEGFIAPLGATKKAF